MKKLTNPCEGCRDKKWCDNFDDTREHIECLPWIAYQAIVQRDREWIEWLDINTLHETIWEEGKEILINRIITHEGWEALKAELEVKE